MLGVYVGIGVLALFVIIMIIVIPKQIRKAKNRVKSATEDYTREIELKTGLKFNGSAFEGIYKGYKVKLAKSMGSNQQAIYEATSDMISGSSFNRNLHGRNTVYPVVKVWLEKPGANFPLVYLFENSNYFLNTDEFWNNRINGRIPEDAKVDVDAKPLSKKAKFYGDADAAQKMVASPQLQSLMSTWVYPDIRANGDKVTLELNNSNILSKLGYKKTAETGYLVQAVDICVATADALS